MIILSVAILIFSIVVHEVAHGWVAYQLGDITAKAAGRLTLNPIPHIDIWGSVIIPGLLVLTGSPILFGWAKPVPYNPYNLQGNFAELKVALAGPVSNIVLAVLFGLLLRFGVAPELSNLFLYGVLINCALAIFNLIPIPPLDGSKILFDLLPDFAARWRDTLERQGFLLVIVFIVFGWQLVAPLIYWLAELIIGSGF